ncbi:CynX/NimT family MFS transporter [Paenactinomyces guangxiensis]|uniref:CynX/NimT family MFS transporter n=1 Tax=Paenactinomyces guangxiensis TaxID=1490290 RepID=UPI0035A9148A
MTTPQTITGKKVLLVLGIIFVAFNLRPAITSVGPLIGLIREDLGISNGVAGFITTLPLIAFALLSLLAPGFARRWGSERAVFLGLLILIIGITARSTGAITGVFLGTALAGIGIAVGNVLLPGIVKQKFPGKVGLMTSVYTTSMSIFAALASGLSIPLAQRLHWGWKNSLAFWAFFTVLAILIWIPQLRNQNKPASIQASQPEADTGALWRSPLAWQVTLFMGLQSFLFYCTVAWLPEILQNRGMNEGEAGWMLSIMQLIGLPVTFLTPVLADRLANQKGIAVLIGVIQFLGTLGLFFHSFAILVASVVMIGISLGGYISLALSLLGLRTRNAIQAARLSGMAQSVGYAFAAVGPSLMGFLFDHLHTWIPSLVIWLIITICLIFIGIGAGRDEYVSFEKKA